jgi:hypothetical protein
VSGSRGAAARTWVTAARTHHGQGRVCQASIHRAVIEPW